MPDNALLANGYPDPLTPERRAFMGWGGPGQPADWYSAMGMTPDMNAGAVPAAPAGNYQQQPQPQQTASTLPAFQPAVPGAAMNSDGTLIGQQPGQSDGQMGGMSPLVMALLQYFGGQGGGGLTLADLLTGRGGALQMGANPSTAISPSPEQGTVQGGSTT